MMMKRLDIPSFVFSSHSSCLAALLAASFCASSRVENESFFDNVAPDAVGVGAFVVRRHFCNSCNKSFSLNRKTNNRFYMKKYFVWDSELPLLTSFETRRLNFVLSA